MDPVAAHHGIRDRGAPVGEMHPDALRLFFVQRDERLVQPVVVLGEQPRQLGQEPAPMQVAVLVGVDPHRPHQVQILALAAAELEPDVLLVGRGVAGADPLVDVHHAAVDAPHRPERVGADGYPGAELAEERLGLVHADPYAAR